MNNTKNNWIKKGLVLLVILAAVLSYVLVPPIHKAMNEIMKMFASGDFTVVRNFVESYGAYAATVSFFLMIFQSVAAPLPAFLITFANANLFGWRQGAIGEYIRNRRLSLSGTDLSNMAFRRGK